MADILYTLDGGVYLNVTNKCPCNCSFCVRNNAVSVGSAKNLWFGGNEPDLTEIKKSIDAFDFSQTDEVVFCGYGEPTERLEIVLKTVQYLREKNSSMKIRLNTNGLSDLINDFKTAEVLGNAFDVISVSLNAADSDSYDKITRNVFSGKAYASMLDFTEECIKYCPDVRMSIVDVIGDNNIAKCREIANKIGAKFICRSFERGR